MSLHRGFVCLGETFTKIELFEAEKITVCGGWFHLAKGVLGASLVGFVGHAVGVTRFEQKPVSVSVASIRYASLGDTRASFFEYSRSESPRLESLCGLDTSAESYYVPRLVFPWGISVLVRDRSLLLGCHPLVPRRATPRNTHRPQHL